MKLAFFQATSGEELVDKVNSIEGADVISVFAQGVRISAFVKVPDDFQGVKVVVRNQRPPAALAYEAKKAAEEKAAKEAAHAAAKEARKARKQRGESEPNQPDGEASNAAPGPVVE